MVSLAGRIFGLSTRALLRPLLARGNAAPTTRWLLEALGSMIGQAPRDVAVDHAHIGGVAVDVLTPCDVNSATAIVYLHGGAYVSGSPRSYRRLVSHLARATRFRVYAVDYRLAPEHPYPAALQDTLAVYAELAADPGIQTCVIAGDSAGGGLALAAALSLRDEGAPMPTALVCIAPWMDLTCSAPSMSTRARRERMMTPAGLTRDAHHYVGTTDVHFPLVSPLFADLHDLPPMFIQVGDDDVLLDDTTRIAAKARAAGVAVTVQVWPHLWHVWHLYAGLMPEADAAIRDIAAFLDPRTGERKEGR